MQWQTTQEKDFDYFLIEKSVQNNDNIAFNFVNIGRINGKNNAQNIISYSFNDVLGDFENTTISTKNIYYRLKMVDKNGDFSYSDVRFIKINNNQNNTQNNIVVYPNPIENNEINIYFTDNFANIEYLDISITNILGQEIYKKSNILTLSKNIKVNTENWSKGVYFIKIIIHNTLIIKKVEIK